MGSFFYWLCFEMSLYVPLLIILSAYFFFRFPALLVAMYYKTDRMDDYWYVVMRRGWRQISVCCCICGHGFMLRRK